MKTRDLGSRRDDDTSPWALALESCDEARIILRRGELHSWEGTPVGTTIRAQEGAVWVTQEGDGRDIILSAGECFRVTRAGRVIAEALQGTAQLGIVSSC